jgi:hypothetical protein
MNIYAFRRDILMFVQRYLDRYYAVRFYLVRMHYYCFDSIKIALVCSAIMVLSLAMRNCLLILMMIVYPWQFVFASHNVLREDIL